MSTTTKYILSDGNAIVIAVGLDEAALIASAWYDYLCYGSSLDSIPFPNLCTDNLDALNASIVEWESAIVGALRKRTWYARGGIYVAASSEAGLNLVVRESEGDSQ